MMHCATQPLRWTLAAALLSGAASPLARDFAPLRVRGSGGDSSISVVSIDGAAMVDAAPLLRLLGGTLVSSELDPVRFRIGTATGELYAGLPFFRADTTPWPLAVAPVRDESRFYVPWQFVTEHLPKLASAITFDAKSRELRSAVPVAVKPAVQPAPRPRLRRVVVDAGHGGKDGGMRARLPDGSGVWEKSIALGIATKHADALKKRGVEVVMTRQRDTLIALADRGKLANRADADLFLSIHVNQAGPAERRPDGVRGFETYFLAEAQTEDEQRVEAMENESVKFDGPSAEATDNLSFILNDMAQNAHLRESSELASAIQFGLLGTHPGKNRGVKQANFAVLRTSFMPAVLIETGFGSNANEAFWLASAAGQRALAESIADATMQYLRGYEARLNSSRTQ
ncbi:MAG TPA: N-acetylmuramoyl-L-alanine amidase [Gemmatimonadaceae bacterium]|nr:N-acetylmuramoyl-L-alanine amidase [Gemmatimonadaceae bacterium]